MAVGGIASSMSPGYLQVNPYFNESASKLSGQFKGSAGEADSVSANKMNKYEIEDTLTLISRNEKKIQEKLDLIAKKEKEKDRLELESKKEEDKKREVANDPKSAKGPLKEQSAEEKAIIDKLKKGELDVIAHEAAHASVGGRFAGSPKYSRTMGPDGKSYITGGEVSISVPASSDPDETVRNMRQVQAAALAPVSPSAQDISVASQAAAAAANAQSQAASELASHQAEWGETPQPARDRYDETDRIQGSRPNVKKYHSSVDNDIGKEDLITSIDRVRKEVAENGEGTIFIDWAAQAGRGSSNSNSSLPPEENLYNTRQARKIYFMNSSPQGLWTVDNGFEKEESKSPELEQAKTLNLAA